jgi:hypothetical protein
MALDPAELLSPRDRLAYNINMRGAGGVDSSAPPTANMPERETAFFGEDGLAFEDFIDIINPLQQLPLISIAYREITGDEISAGARIIGGGLYGGPAGVIFAAANAAVVEASGGKDLGAIALDSVIGGGEPIETAASDEVGLSAADTSALEPAAGSGASAPKVAAWVDPDTLPQTATAAPLTPMLEPLNARPPSAVAASDKPPTAAAGFDTIPELSEDQVALLLSSVGLGGQNGSSQARQALTAGKPAGVAESDTIDPPQQAPRLGPRRDTMGPMKQIYVRPPVSAKVQPHAPVTPEMRSHMTPASAGDGANQTSIANAMAQALDKYRNGDTLKPGEQNKGAIVDGSH